MYMRKYLYLMICIIIKVKIKFIYIIVITRKHCITSISIFTNNTMSNLLIDLTYQIPNNPTT